MFVTTRPADLPAWAEADHVETLTLDGLDAAGTERLAAAIAGAELDDDAIDRLHGRTAGNPLFVGETVRALLEDDALVARGGRLSLRDADGVGGVPVNLRALLGARIDGLPAGSRWILQVASVVGMTFDPALVAKLMGRTAVGRAAGRPGRRRRRGSDRRIDGLAVQPPAHPRCGLRLDPRVAPAGPAREARRPPRGARSAGPARPARAASRRGAATASGRSRCSNGRPMRPIAAGAVVEAVGYWRTALALLGDDPGAASDPRAHRPARGRRRPRSLAAPVRAATSRRSPG